MTPVVCEKLENPVTISKEIDGSVSDLIENVIINLRPECVNSENDSVREQESTGNI